MEMVEIRIDLKRPGFQQQLADGDPFADTAIDIIVDGISLSGPGDILEFVVVNCRRMLECVDDILHGEDVVLPYQGTPGDFGICPENGEAVRVWIGSHDESYNSEVPREGLPVSKETLVEEMIETSEELYEFVGETNPILLKDPAVASLNEAIEDAKQSLEMYRVKEE